MGSMIGHQRGHVGHAPLCHTCVRRSHCLSPSSRARRARRVFISLELAPGSIVTASHVSHGTAPVEFDVALYIISTARPGERAARRASLDTAVTSEWRSRCAARTRIRQSRLTSGW